ncbi:unnamed protein product [Diatraea saccharalis]|uniref:Ionotropic glutamate receptor L-glutamate and glycine-binding domain-containing protein n=1 Tax=Diatraea saccharalis TaxID=40085 RepID=A0A9N9R4I3_9NEOP|nr:unnamed protein product [Diatraea saccharalis]
MVTHHFWPFVNFNNSQNKSYPVHKILKTDMLLYGVNDLIMQLWCEHAGVTVEMLRYEKDQMYGRVLRNYTYTGMLSWIEEKKLDGATGGYTITFSRAKALDYTFPFLMDQELAVVARARMLSSWESVFVQFNCKTVNDYDIKTFNRDVDACGRPVIKVLQSITRCSKLSRNVKVFNVKKNANFRGCHIRMVAHHFWPFVNFNNSQNKSYPVHKILKTDMLLYGVNDLIMQLWCDHAGVTVEMMRYEKDQMYGRVTRNYTFTGMLSWLEEKKLDGAIGGYTISLSRAKALDYTFPFLIDQQLAVVARARMLTSWESVFVQFNCLLVLPVILFVTIESRVVETNQSNISQEGSTVEVIIKPNHDENTDLDLNTVRQKRNKIHNVEVHDEISKTEDKMPFNTTTARTIVLSKLESRTGVIVVGNCPKGFIATGNICILDYD